MTEFNVHQESNTNDFEFHDTLDIDPIDNLSIDRDNNHSSSSSFSDKEIPIENIDLLSNLKKKIIQIIQMILNKNIEIVDDISDNGNNFNFEDMGDDPDYEQQPIFESNNDEYRVPEPEKTYAEILEEKQDYLFKINRFIKSGSQFSKKLTLASNIEDIKYEYNRLKRERDIEKSVKFSRKALMACVSGIEFLNGKVDPFDVKLDGWSETIMENIDDYDEVFEELHDKYKGRGKTAPELRLLMMVGGSGFMFHLTNSLMKSAMPNVSDILKNNPDLANNIKKAAFSSMNNKNDPVMNMIHQGNEYK